MLKTLLSTTLALALCASFAFTQDKGKGGAKGGGKAAPNRLALSSPDFPDGGVIPDKFTAAAGANSPSPRLQWTNVPEGTQSFAIVFHDPDVAINKMPEDVLHWMIFNIPGNVTSLDGGLPAGNLPNGAIQAKARNNQNAYMGPGNPAGNPDHHYTFEIFALDTKLTLDANATRDDVLKAMGGHIIGKGVLVGRFKRS